MTHKYLHFIYMTLYNMSKDIGLLCNLYEVIQVLLTSEFEGNKMQNSMIL